MRLFKRKPKQFTWCYCPQCREDLCSNDSFVRDDDEGVFYRCTVCGCTSLWNFDIAPFPVMIEYQEMVSHHVAEFHDVMWPDRLKEV